MTQPSRTDQAATPISVLIKGGRQLKIYLKLLSSVQIKSALPHSLTITLSIASYSRFHDCKREADRPWPWAGSRSLPGSCWLMARPPSLQARGCTPRWTSSGLSSCSGSWLTVWGQGQVWEQISKQINKLIQQVWKHFYICNRRNCGFFF